MFLSERVNTLRLHNLRPQCHALLIIRLIAPFMSSRVDQPGDIQDERVAEHGGDEESVFEGFSPTVNRNHCGHDEAQQRHQEQVVLLLESQDWVSLQVGNV